MPGSTSRGFPYPLTSESPHGPNNIQALADAVQAELDSALTLGSSLTVATDLTVGAGAIKLNPLLVIKPSAESVTSSTTLQNDDHLVLALAANKKYNLEIGLSTDGSLANDFKMSFAAITGATCLLTGVGPWVNSTDGSTSTMQISEALTEIQTYGCIAAFDHRAIMIRGVIQMAGTAGNLQLQWAQNGSGGTATRVLGSSYMLAYMCG